MTALRSRRAIRMLSVAAATYAASAGTLLLAQQQPLPAGVPAAPPGGVIGSKLPDTNGVHLGMTQDEAIAVMRRLYPDHLTIYYDKAPTGAVWTGRLSGTTDVSCPNGCETMEVALSMPPSPVQVVAIQRTINLAAGKQPTLDNTIASLRQKYGKELPLKEGAAVMSWAYDEQGQPIIPQGPPGWQPDCADAGGTPGTFAGYPDPRQPLEIDAALAPIPLAQQVPNLTKNPCNQNVYVHVQLGISTIQNTQVVGQIFIKLGEQSMMLRDAVADQQVFDGLAAAKRQQQQNANTQQKAPSL